MSYRNREIEIKLLSNVSDLDIVNSLIRDHFRNERTNIDFGASLDNYWRIADEKVKGDFLRTRELDNGSVQITVKSRDRDTLLDRMEIEIESSSSRTKILKLFNAVLGRPAGIIKKSYYVHWLDKHTNVSCYKVLDPDYSRVIVEIESNSEERVLQLEKRVISLFDRNNIDLERATGSLFDMLIWGESNGK